MAGSSTSSFQNFWSSMPMRKHASHGMVGLERHVSQKSAAASVLIRDLQGKHALDYALRDRKAEVVEALLSVVFSSVPPSLFAALNADGFPALLEVRALPTV